MIFIPEKEAPLTEPDLLRTLMTGLPRAYAVLFFSANLCKLCASAPLR